MIPPETTLTRVTARALAQAGKLAGMNAKIAAMRPAVRPGEAGVPAAVSGGVIPRPGLFGQLDRAGRVIEISAPAGSGKTVLVRSWIGESGQADRTGWVTIQRGERDPQRFWISVADALRGTAPGSALVRPMTAAPDLDGWAVVEVLLKDLAALDERIWLVINDVQELRSAEALRQLELLVMRAPPELRFVLATRHDLALGLHRVRLEGELTEIRAADLRFTRDEARALFDDAGVDLSEPSMTLLCERTEGWAAGLRLAALSLARHPDPEGFVAGFSGSERTIAEYLLAEVLRRQPRQVHRLLLRTSVLERVNGELADLLTGGSGGARILQQLEKAGAFVVSLDAQRTWFRYHRLFADLLQFELQAAEPDKVPALHATAASWLAGHGFPVEAVRHAQAAGDWSLAARLLGDHWLGLALDGQAGTARELLARFPADVVDADAELTALRADSEITRGSLEEAERHLARAAAGSASVPVDRRGGFQLQLAVQRLRLARTRSDLPAAVEEAQQVLALAEAAEAVRQGLGEDVRAMALVSLGTAELSLQQFDAAERHLEQAIAVARRTGRPFTEVSGLANAARVAAYRSMALAVERCTQAIELARQHGWAEHPVLSSAYTVLAMVMVLQGQFEEAERWLRSAERTLRAETEPATGVLFHHLRGALELAYGRYADALAAFRAAGKQAELLISPHPLLTQARSLMVHTLLHAGDIQAAERALAETDEQQRETGEMRTAVAALWLARGDPGAALEVLAPVLGGSAGAITPARIGGYVLEAIAREAAGDSAAAENALERALDLAEPDHVLLPFLVDRPPPELLERHCRRRTAHAALAAEILALLDQGRAAYAVPGEGRPAEAVSPGSRETRLDSAPVQAEPLLEPLSEAEMRILRYLPTNLTAPEIANELYLSVHTIKTHIRHLYAKLGVHGRGDAVQRARALGLLAPSSGRR
jgi:LuxR family transcriptional regulator, maltose regulon positive regulatory protein